MLCLFDAFRFQESTFVAIYHTPFNHRDSQNCNYRASHSTSKIMHAEIANFFTLLKHVDSFLLCLAVIIFKKKVYSKFKFHHDKVTNDERHLFYFNRSFCPNLPAKSNFTFSLFHRFYFCAVALGFPVHTEISLD